MTSKDLTNELRLLSGGGLITAREVAVFVRDKNVSRVKDKYLSGLDNCMGKYLVTDVARRIKEASRER